MLHPVLCTENEATGIAAFAPNMGECLLDIGYPFATFEMPDKTELSPT